MDTAALLEHLPVPVLYLARDRCVSYANSAARDVIHPSRNPTQSFTGLSIFETSFIDEHLALGYKLDLALDEAEADFLKHVNQSPISNGTGAETGDTDHGEQPSSATQGRDIGDIDNSLASLKLDPASRKNHIWLDRRQQAQDDNSLRWKLSTSAVSKDAFFVLTAESVSPLPSWQDTKPSSAEEQALFEQLAQPLHQSVEYDLDLPNQIACTIPVSGDHVHLKSDGVGDQLWNEDFTVAITGNDDVDKTRFEEGQNSVSILRGYESAVDGTRKIKDTTATMLTSPFTGKPLGVILQVRQEQEWTDYIRYQDIVSRTVASPSGEIKVPDMVRTMLIDGQFDYFSASWLYYVGSTREELCAGSWKDYIHPEDMPELDRVRTWSMANGASSDCNIRIRRGPGTPYRYFEDRIAPLKDGNGDVSRWYYISTDVHELMLSRQASNQAASRLYSLLNSIEIINVFSADKEYTIRSAEGAMRLESTAGAERLSRDYVGLNLEAICAEMIGESSNVVFSQFASVMQGLTPRVDVDYQIGDLFLRTFVVPELSDTETSESGRRITGILGLTLDFTAEHNSRKADMALAAMAESERLKSEFLANVSHELRTPIAGLLGIVEMLLETQLTDAQKDFANTLQSLAESLLTIVNGILDFSRAESRAIEVEKLPFEIAGILEAVCKCNEPLAAKKSIQLLHDPFKQMPLLLGDPGRIRQILQNLVANAIKFTHEGFVRLETTWNNVHDGVELTIVIQDTGIGIDKETLQLLFRPFVQADQSTTRLYGGSGLGLSIARTLARAMGGDVVLQSKKGEGTRAVFTLRLAMAPDQPPNSPVLKMAKSSRSGSVIKDEIALGQSEEEKEIHILVVEDNAVNRKIAVAHLGKLGFSEIGTVNDGIEALEYMAPFLPKAEASTPETAASSDLAGTLPADSSPLKPVSRLPDVVLMDCQMPRLDGYGATRKLRSWEFGGPIIALTASAIQGDKERCIDAGMDDYLPKPFTRKQLGEMIQKWSGDRQGFTGRDA